MLNAMLQEMQQGKNDQEDSGKNNRCIFRSHDQFTLSKVAQLAVERIILRLIDNPFEIPILGIFCGPGLIITQNNSSLIGFCQAS